MEKKYELILMFIVAGIVLIILTPTIIKIIYDTEKPGIEASASNEIEAIQVLFARTSIVDMIDLPFMVKYSEDGYETYSDNARVYLTFEIERDGKAPTGGEIVIERDGQIVVRNLVYDDYICQKEYLKDISCERSS